MKMFGMSSFPHQKVTNIAVKPKKTSSNKGERCRTSHSSQDSPALLQVTGRNKGNVEIHRDEMLNSNCASTLWVFRAQLSLKGWGRGQILIGKSKPCPGMTQSCGGCARSAGTLSHQGISSEVITEPSPSSERWEWIPLLLSIPYSSLINKNAEIRREKSTEIEVFMSSMSSSKAECAIPPLGRWMLRQGVVYSQCLNYHCPNTT